VTANWYPDPSGAPQWRFWDGAQWTDQVAPYSDIARQGPSPVGPKLDAAVVQLRGEDDTPWGSRPVLLSLGAFVAVIVASFVLNATVNPQGYNAKVTYAIVANVLVEAFIGFVVWTAGRDIAARYGGWGATFGLWRPKWIDLAYAACGIVVVFVGDIVIAGVANGVTHGRAGKQSQNVHLHTVTPVTVTLLFFIIVVCAPVIEEIVFRGLLLRAFMRRFSFWPAAVASTLIFALFHTYEVHTLAGAITLACVVGWVGLVNCVLNRYTNRLTPGIVLHATFNLISLVVLVAQA
jgi:membrane protease YdiL (CAAX protease family)